MKPQPLSKFAVAQTRARLKRVIAAVRFATRHPQDPETAHDLRVAIRRFSQCLRMFEGLFEERLAEKMLKRGRKLLHLCGAKRDYDVGLQLLADAGLPPHSSVLLKFREQRDRGERALVRYLGKKSTRDDASRWRKRLRPSAHPGGKLDWSSGVAENARRMMPELVGEFFNAGDAAMEARGDYEVLHQFRLRAKHLRYALEVFEPAYGAPLKTGLLALRGLQDRMGAINDCVVVLALPGMDRAAARAVRKLLVAREAAFREYWSKTFSPRARTAWVRLLTHPGGRVKLPEAPSEPSHRKRKSAHPA